MTLNRRQEIFMKLAYLLIDESDKGVPIIVEGKKDLEALKRIGVKGKICCIKSSRLNFTDLIDELKEEKEMIIMTDFDKEGDELARQLSSALIQMRVKVNISIRSRMKNLVKKDIKAIEELADYYEKTTSVTVFQM